MHSKNIIFILFFIFGFNNLRAQIFKLDSIILSEIITNQNIDAIKKNENNKGRLPIFVSEDIITLFHLHDTVVNGIEIDYFINVNEMIKKYEVKNTGSYMTAIYLQLEKANLGKLALSLDYYHFFCDKDTVRGKVLHIRDGRFTSEFDVIVPNKIEFKLVD